LTAAHLAGVLILAAMIAISGYGALGSARSARGTGIIMPIIMCILVASQIGAIAAARRRSGA
jgi:hypothetical protein